MTKCPFCSTSHVANTVFCNECGNYLLEEDQRKTDPLENGETGWTGETTDGPRETPASQPNAKPVVVQLKIGDRHREIEISLDKIINIGRVDPTTTIFPEVDLTDEGPPAKSVSRRHARILKQENMVKLEDMGSVNGTFINGTRLDPYMPEAISDGDLLQLGKLSIKIKIRHR
ncbi:FHA domain-containing protein [Chloroflexota bacterium]